MPHVCPGRLAPWNQILSFWSAPAMADHRVPEKAAKENCPSIDRNSWQNQQPPCAGMNSCHNFCSFLFGHDTHYNHLPVRKAETNIWKTYTKSVTISEMKFASPRCSYLWSKPAKLSKMKIEASINRWRRWSIRLKVYMEPEARHRGKQWET